MRYLIAILIPWQSFLNGGDILAGIVCFVLQLTFIGWIPAALWAVFNVYRKYAPKPAPHLGAMQATVS